MMSISFESKFQGPEDPRFMNSRVIGIAQEIRFYEMIIDGAKPRVAFDVNILDRHLLDTRQGDYKYLSTGPVKSI
jgi:hypothetical protein